MLKAGAGVGLAALGIGLAGLLILYGVSLLIDRPTREEMASALREQAVSLERLAAEKIIAVRIEAGEKLAIAEKEWAARLAATKQEASEKVAAADKAAATARTAIEKFASGPTARTVVDFTIFRRNEVGDLGVNTGWNYNSVSDQAPSFQYCHVYKRTRGADLQIPIAANGEPLPFNPEHAAKADITRDDVLRALPSCDWFKGANPNIH